MSEMVERVKAALARRRGRTYPHGLSRRQHADLDLDARAVMAAMREPTEALVLAGAAVEKSSLQFEGDARFTLNGWRALETYRAMVDEALR